jgi:uncharacterized cofD-like protein
MASIVTIGGGTGTYTVLSGLVTTGAPLDLCAVISVADNGGSTGRLRDEFGYLPMGDMRMALVALAETESGRNVLRELFLYRFDKGEGLTGHNFGNLFLVAMTDILGSEERAIEYAAQVLRVRGSVVPVSKDDVHLVARYDDGTELRGETTIDEQEGGHDGTKQIVHVHLDPAGDISESAHEAIMRADLIVLGPGDLYTSTIANLLVAGVPEALANTRGRMVQVLNLMTKYGQTHNLTAAQHVNTLAMYAMRLPDIVVVNNSPLSADMLAAYDKEHAAPVIDDLPTDAPYAVVRADILANELVHKKSGDTLKRSLIRHDSAKLARLLLTFLP